MLTRPQSRPLLLGLVVLGIMIVGALWLEGYVRDQFVNAFQISDQVAHGRRGWTEDQLEACLAETKPGGAGWKLLTFICCTVAAWFLFFAETSGLVVAFVAWLLAWACALAMRMNFNRRLA